MLRRNFFKLFFCLFFTPFLFFFQKFIPKTPVAKSPSRKSKSFSNNDIYDIRPQYIYTVSGKGCYNSMQAALDSIPKDLTGKGCFGVAVKKGT